MLEQKEAQEDDFLVDNWENLQEEFCFSFFSSFLPSSSFPSLSPLYLPFLPVSFLTQERSDILEQTSYDYFDFLC